MLSHLCVQVIVGAGIGGLTLAYDLERRGIDYLVLEKAKCVVVARAVYRGLRRSLSVLLPCCCCQVSEGGRHGHRPVEPGMEGTGLYGHRGPAEEGPCTA